MTDPRYPIGPFAPKARYAPEETEAAMQAIDEAPRRLREVVRGLSKEQLRTPYRPSGWTVLQVAHHLPDSHLNAYVRTKLALTEDEPTIKTYEEARWAELPDALSEDVETSVRLLESLHARWVRLLRSLKPRDLARRFVHPEQGPVPIERAIALYAWHGRHHVAHIASLREREGWK
jgi:hypothetical protein